MFRALKDKFTKKSKTLVEECRNCGYKLTPTEQTFDKCPRCRKVLR